MNFRTWPGKYTKLILSLNSTAHTTHNKPTPLVATLQSSQIPLASIRSNTRNNRRIGRGRSNILALKVRQEPLVTLTEIARATKPVDLAHTAQIRGTDLVGGRIRRSKQLAVDGRLRDRVDVLEDVALGQDVATRADFEGVPAVVVPVVVDLRSYFVNRLEDIVWLERMKD